MARLSDRVRRLEVRHSSGLQVIVITGGLPDGFEDDRATAGDGITWRRSAGETGDSFRKRAMAEAISRGVSFMIFGGLPERNVVACCGAANSSSGS